MKIDPAVAPQANRTGVRTVHLSDAGGLTQFGAYIESLEPGAWSSDRHWHTAEDEFLYVLTGTTTLHDDDGMQDLGPGDAVCWPHGDPNAHHLSNRTADAARYLIVGSRAFGDVCHYPESGRRQVNDATRWRVEEADGTVLREGELPPELRGLPPAWGMPFCGTAMQRVQRAAGRVWHREAAAMHPVLGVWLGTYDHVILGDTGGLSQFGAHLERLPPGSRSSIRHWHEAEDEFLLMLAGQVILHEDEGEAPLRAGDAAAWPAGHADAHCLENRSREDAVYLTIGTRKPDDIIHYPDHDRIVHKTGPARRWMHGDSTPVEV